MTCPNSESHLRAYLLNDFATRDLNVLGFCKGKFVAAQTSDGRLFTIRWAYPDEIAFPKLTDLLASLFQHEKVECYVIVFSGSFEKFSCPPEHCLIVVEGDRSNPEILISQLESYRNKKGWKFTETHQNFLEKDNPFCLFKPPIHGKATTKALLKTYIDDPDSFMAFGLEPTPSRKFITKH